MEYQYQNMPFKIIVGMRRLQDFESFWSSDFQGILSIPAFADTIRKVWKALSINIQNIKRRREINKLSVLTASLLVVSKPDNRDDGHSHKWRGTRWPLSRSWPPSPSPWSSPSPSPCSSRSPPWSSQSPWSSTQWSSWLQVSTRRSAEHVLWLQKALRCPTRTTPAHRWLHINTHLISNFRLGPEQGCILFPKIEFFINHNLEALSFLWSEMPILG